MQRLDLRLQRAGLPAVVDDVVGGGEALRARRLHRENGLASSARRWPTWRCRR